MVIRNYRPLPIDSFLIIFYNLFIYNATFTTIFITEAGTPAESFGA